MSEKYQNKYRVASARAQWWDYGWNGAYFITICTHHREHFFGEVDNGTMRLSRTGVVADILWHQIPHHAPFVELGDFVVMPNHIHGIIILDKPDRGEQNNENHDTNRGVDAETGTTTETGNDGGENGNANDDGNDNDNVNVETGHALSLR